jgi:hypothetical protein
VKASEVPEIAAWGNESLNIVVPMKEALTHLEAGATYAAEGKFELAEQEILIGAELMEELGD